MSLARELARYEVDVTVIEKEPDVSMGISKTAGSLIYMGLFQALSLVIKDLGRGADLIQETRTERMRMLWVVFRPLTTSRTSWISRISMWGLLIIARNEDEKQKLNYLEELCKYVPGGTVRHVAKEELFELEPNLTRDAIEGLYDSTGRYRASDQSMCTPSTRTRVENGATVYSIQMRAGR